MSLICPLSLCPHIRSHRPLNRFEPYLEKWLSRAMDSALVVYIAPGSRVRFQPLSFLFLYPPAYFGLVYSLPPPPFLWNSIWSQWVIYTLNKRNPSKKGKKSSRGRLTDRKCPNQGLCGCYLSGEWRSGQTPPRPHAFTPTPQNFQYLLFRITFLPHFSLCSECGYWAVRPPGLGTAFRSSSVQFFKISFFLLLCTSILVKKHTCWQITTQTLCGTDKWLEKALEQVKQPLLTYWEITSAFKYSKSYLSHSCSLWIRKYFTICLKCDQRCRFTYMYMYVDLPFYMCVIYRLCQV